MLRLLSSTAIALVLAGGPLMAQSDAPAPAANELSDPSESSSVIWERANEAWISDDLIGAEVVNAEDETLGDIEELLVAVADDTIDAPADAPADVPALDGSASIEGETETSVDEFAETPAGELAEPELDGSASIEGETETSVDEFAETPAGESAEPEFDSSASIEGETESPAADAPAGEPDAGQPDADTAMNDGYATESEASPEGFSMDGTADREMTDNEAMQELPQTGSEPGSDLAESETDGSALPEGDIAGGGTLYSEPLPSEGESVMTPSQPAIADLSVTDFVLGIGGFLGIGEKRVAIPVERFEFFVGNNNEKKIVLNATYEELEGMPDYVERDDGLAGETAPAPIAE